MANYRDYLFKINYTNNIFCQNSTQKDVCYKVYIGKGNNRALIKNLFKNRWWWEIIDEPNYEECNFVWTQLKIEDYIKMMKNFQQNEADQQKSITKESSNNLNLNQANNSQNSIQQQENQIQENANNNDQINLTNKQILIKNDNQSNEKNNQITELNQINTTSQIQNEVQQKQLTPNKKQNIFIQYKQQILQQLKQQCQGYQNYEDNHLKIFNFEDYLQFAQYIKNYGDQDSNMNPEDFSFRLNYFKNKKFQKIEQSYQLKSHNHLQCNWNLGNKKGMFYNLRQYYEFKQDNVFNYVPLTFHIIKGLDDKEFKNFLHFYQSRDKELHSNTKCKTECEEDRENKLNNGKTKNLLGKDQYKQPARHKNIWIVKPGEMTNRGNGITVCDNLKDIKKILACRKMHPNGKLITYIVQEYIDRPLLYNKRKFDIRCYMLINSVNNIIKAYWYQEGYIRTSSREFNIDDVSDTFIHLTNDAVQKYAEEYGKFESHNKLSFQELQRYLDLWYPEMKYNFYEQIYPQMKKIAQDAIRATFIKVDPQRKEYTFEIFGFDFMIDENFQVWLIEINTNPCLETGCQHLVRIIPNMVEQAMRIGLDTIFPPPTYWPNSKKHLAPDNLLENNKFELIFDELQDGAEIKKLYENSANCLEGVDAHEEEEEWNDSGDEEVKKNSKKNY